MAESIGNTTTSSTDHESTLRESVNYTLVMPIDYENECIFLAKKARGTGKGKWLGFGGKIDGDETALDGAIREMKEETGLNLSPKQLTKSGLILFTFLTDPVVKAEMHVFTCDKSDFDENQVRLNDEFLGNGQWFKRHEMPVNEMWKDFQLWHPKCFERKRFRAIFNYVPKEELVSYSMCEVTDASDALLTVTELQDVVHAGAEINQRLEAKSALQSG